jgi:vitamin B12 transporter
MSRFSFLKSSKKLVPLFALGMGYQFEVPQASFFQTSPSNEEVLSETISERENVHPVEALKTLPGMILLGSEVTTYTGSLFLRGASADHTLFIWNDLRSDDFTSPAGATDPFGISTEFSNKIRVLKGPQSLLYGTQALGGVVLVDEDADLDSSFALAGGSLESVKSTAEYRHRFESATAAVGASGFATNGLSTYDAPLRQGIGGELERDGHNQRSGTAILTLDLANNDQVQFLANASQHKLADDVPPQDDTDAKTERKTEQWKLRYRKNWNEKLKSLFLLTGQRSLRDSRNFPDARSLDEYEDISEGQRFVFLNRNTLKAASSLWHFGFELSEDQGEFFSRSNFQPVASKVQARRQEQSLYLVNDWIFARSDASIGARGSCQESSDCVGVYQASYQWHWPESQRSVYGIVSTGLKRATLYQLYSGYGNPNLKSEISQAYEIGVLQRWDRPHKVKVSLFQNDFSDLIDYNFVTTKYQNLNKARTVGVEFLHQYEAVFWDSELSLAQISAKDESRGLNLLRRPQQQASWTVGFKVFESLRWINEGIYLGERDDNDALGSRMTLPSVLLWNTAFVFKKDQHTQLFLRVNNAGNTFYEDLRGYLTPGRFVWTGLKISF